MMLAATNARPRELDPNVNPNALTPEQQELVTDNVSLLHWVALRYFNRSPFLQSRFANSDDAVSAGAIGMVKAARLFDPSRGFKFSTYATNVIERCILRAAQEELVVRIPINFFSRANAGRAERFGRAADAALSCQSLPGDFEPETVDEMPEDYSRLHERIGDLDGCEQAVIRMYFWEKLTLQAIGLEIGVKRERVRQIRDAAVAKLRGAMKLGLN